MRVWILVRENTGEQSDCTSDLYEILDVFDSEKKAEEMALSIEINHLYSDCGKAIEYRYSIIEKDVVTGP